MFCLMFCRPQSSNANPNAAAANFLSYIGKRLAFFDEPSSNEGTKRIDIRRLKDLSSGDSRIRGRMLHSNDVVEASWQALIVIACNDILTCLVHFGSWH